MPAAECDVRRAGRRRPGRTMDDRAGGRRRATWVGQEASIDGDMPGSTGPAEERIPTAAIAQRDEYLDSLRRCRPSSRTTEAGGQAADRPAARAALLLVDKLLPVLDTLDLATAHIGDAESADGAALLAAASQLRDVLAKEGLERIDPLGEEFDPNAHEAVGHCLLSDGPAPIHRRSRRTRTRIRCGRASRWWPR